MLRFRSTLGIIAAGMIFFIGCGEPIPIQEMVQSRKAISKALSVNADKYAPEDVKKAKEKLFECHDYITKEDLDKAKSSASESAVLADQAYDKSVPLLAKDTIAISEKSLEESREVYAERLAKDEFDEADKTLKKSNEQFQNKEYYESYMTAVEADKLAKNARNISLSKKVLLEDAIVEVKYTLEQASKYNSDKYSSEKYTLAMENLNIAEKSYAELKLKRGFSAIEVARINADEAYIESLKGTSAAKLDNAAEVLKKAEKSDGAAVAKEELAASKEAFENAKLLQPEGKYKESMDFSDQAVNNALVVIATKKPVDTPVVSDVNVKGASKDIKNNINQEDKKQFVEKRKKVYKIRKDDYLRKISKKFYKNEMMWKKIYRSNKKKIKNPDLIFPDDIIVIPNMKK